MTKSDPNEVLLTLDPSPFRRWTGVFVFVMLGAVLLWLAAQSQQSFAWMFAFLALGIASLWMADWMRRATANKIELTRSELRTDGGVILARVDEVSKVERGAFAFKPTHGFLVRLKEKKPRGWAPGLWWRAGKMVGVGGIVNAGQAKAMAEILTALITDDLPKSIDDLF